MPLDLKPLFVYLIHAAVPADSPCCFSCLTFALLLAWYLDLDHTVDCAAAQPTCWYMYGGLVYRVQTSASLPCVKGASWSFSSGGVLPNQDYQVVCNSSLPLQFSTSGQACSSSAASVVVTAMASDAVPCPTTIAVGDYSDCQLGGPTDSCEAKLKGCFCILRNVDGGYTFKQVLH